MCVTSKSIEKHQKASKGIEKQRLSMPEKFEDLRQDSK
jgi:hypothetical protein